MIVAQITQQGTEKEKINLNDEVFGAEVNEALVAQYVHVHRERTSLHTKKTKGRGEVSGGGRKPWRQKGTGRARHGSIRSPLWVGGGHTHPIVPTLFRRVRMSKQMRIRAMLSILSDAMRQNKIILVDQLNFKEGKTKEMTAILKDLNLVNQKVMFVLSQKDQKTEQAIANLPKVSFKMASVLGVVDVLENNKLVLVGDAYQVLEQGVKKL